MHQVRAYRLAIADINASELNALKLLVS